MHFMAQDPPPPSPINALYVLKEYFYSVTDNFNAAFPYNLISMLVLRIQFLLPHFGT